MLHPYEPPSEVDDAIARTETWTTIATSDRVSLMIAVCVAATIFLAFVDWTTVIG